MRLCPRAMRMRREFAHVCTLPSYLGLYQQSISIDMFTLSQKKVLLTLSQNSATFSATDNNQFTRQTQAVLDRASNRQQYQKDRCAWQIQEGFNMNIKFTKAARQKKIASHPRYELPCSKTPSLNQRSAAAAMADGGQYLDADYGGEDKEVKLNLRFCDK